MNLYEWVLNQLLPVFMPQEALDFVLYYLKSNGGEGQYTAVTVSDAIGAFLACVIGFCTVYFLCWVPFRGILHLLRWRRWRGY